MYLGLCLKLSIVFGRSIGPDICDREEVCVIEARNIGNWAQDVYQKDYFTKLPLGTLRFS